MPSNNPGNYHWELKINSSTKDKSNLYHLPQSLWFGEHFSIWFVISYLREILEDTTCVVVSCYFAAKEEPLVNPYTFIVSDTLKKKIRELRKIKSLFCSFLSQMSFLTSKTQEKQWQLCQTSTWQWEDPIPLVPNTTPKCILLNQWSRSLCSNVLLKEEEIDINWKLWT